ncbi:MAG: hypothetical protein KDC85_13075 [Saprospiraceae bacterium]|nr:hypothetical protein [Saprospiraceae bacterium]MCB9325491.1 hypothetical protein [Lewinellaceae bacterium]
MKKLYGLVSILFLVSCKENLPKKGIAGHQILQKTENTENALKVDTRSISEILPMKTGMSEKDIATCFFVADTLNNDFNELIGTTKVWNDRWPMMIPAVNNGYLTGVFDLDDSTWVIPFFTDRKKEVQIFTKWRIVANKGLTYAGRFKPSLSSKYAFHRLLEKVDVRGQEYLIGKTEGGREGNSWQIIWTAKYNGTDDFHKTDLYGVDNAAGKSKRSLYYKLEGSDLSIIMEVDSVASPPEGMLDIPTGSMLVKKVDLNPEPRLKETEALFENIFKAPGDFSLLRAVPDRG